MKTSAAAAAVAGPSGLALPARTQGTPIKPGSVSQQTGKHAAFAACLILVPVSSPGPDFVLATLIAAPALFGIERFPICRRLTGGALKQSSKGGPHG